jgi:hypothetical protein
MLDPQGNLFHYKYCEDCLSVREVFFSDGWYYGLLWEQMQQFVLDCDGNISMSQLGMVTIPARDKIIDMVAYL